MTPERVKRSLDHLTSLLDDPGGPLGAIGALPDSAARALLLAGPAACRDSVKRAAEVVSALAPLFPASLAGSSALQASAAASLSRIAETTGLTLTPLPVADWLDVLERESREVPELRVPLILLAIDVAPIERSKALAKKRLADDAQASLTKQKRDFLVELAVSVDSGRASPELASTWKRVLDEYPILDNPLWFGPDELFLIARLLRVRVEGASAAGVAQELHDEALRRASA